MNSKIALAFMIVPEHPIEWQSLLLAASINEFVTRPVNIYFCAEEKHVSMLSEQTKNSIKSLGGTLRILPSKNPFKGPYAIGNKILACNMNFSEDRVVFLDSDMMFTKPTNLGRITVGDICLQQEFGRVWTLKAGNWDYIYNKFNISQDVVNHYRKLADKYFYPYFNAGVISFLTKSKFSEKWLSVAGKIDHDPNVKLKRPWLDQIALPIALMQHQLDLRILPHYVNRRPNRDIYSDLILAHYHGLVMLRMSSLGHVADRCVSNHLKYKSLAHMIKIINRDSARSTNKRLTKTLIPARSNKGRLPFVKIFGERNTGTNLLKIILTSNFDVRPLDLPSETAKYLATARQAFGSVPVQNHQIRDLLHQYTYETEFGWKHAKPDAGRVQNNARYTETKFLCIYKHPAFWLKSTYQRPYNPYQKKSSGTFFDFISTNFSVSERDMVDDDFSGGPLDLYQEKLRGYLDLKRQNPKNTLIVPYEEMIEKQDVFLKLLTGHFWQNRLSLTFPSKASKPIDSNKHGLKTADYIEKYSKNRIFEGFNASSKSFYDEIVDDDLFHSLEQYSCFTEKFAK